jgi:hypothetical protein
MDVTESAAKYVLLIATVFAAIGGAMHLLGA